jgi:O-antigen/teichoic acid export membrane protein
LAAALKIGLNLLLIPRWGSDGAAVGTVIMLTVFSGLAWRDVRRLVGIEPTLLASFGFLPRPIVGAPNGTSELQAPAPRAIAEERAA